MNLRCQQGGRAVAKTRRGDRPLPLVASVQEAVGQALRIAAARKGGRYRSELRRSNSSVQEWILVPTPSGAVFVSAKMGGHRWDTLDDYYRWHDKGLLGGDGVRVGDPPEKFQGPVGFSVAVAGVTVGLPQALNLTSDNCKGST